MRIAVLGAGVVGVTTAYWLARDGHEVTVIDRLEGPALETSFSNAGMVSPGHAYTWASPRAPRILWQSLFRDDVALRLKPRLDPQMWAWCWRFLQECPAERAAVNTAHKVRLCLYSRDAFAAINAELDLDYDRQTQGAIYVYRDAEHFERGVRGLQVLADNGVTLEAVDVDRAIAIEPALAPDRDALAGAIFCPIDESGDCHRFTNLLAEHCASSLGVIFQWSTTVQRLVAEAGRIEEVRTDRGPLRADAYVLAAGAFSRSLGRQVGVDLPIYPVKGYALTIPIEGANGAPRLCGVDERYLIAWSRLGDRLRVTATAEFAGFDKSVSAKDTAHMTATIRRLFPNGGAYEKATAWAGLRPMTPKGTPILGRSPQANLFLNTGHGHIGWTMSMGSAKIVADVIAGRRPEIDTTGLTLADA